MEDLVKKLSRIWERLEVKKHVDTIKRSPWKNSRPLNNEAYVPTLKEHLANIITHGVLVLPIGWLSWNMVMSAHGPAQLSAVVIYSIVLIGLFTVSTVFHTVAMVSRNRLLHDIFHRSDRAMIYLFIAGSYTPWLNLKHLTGASQELRWAVWLLAILGIAYQQTFHEKYKWLETTFYVTIALFPSIVIFEMPDRSGIAELQLGGAIYMLGVIFFKADGIIPLAHAIWHLHVVVGALLHYYAVCSHLLIPGKCLLDN
jgi:monocyte-to-macrophage differentiation protein